jgi:phospholipase C
MSLSSVLTSVRQHATVSISLMALFANMGAPLNAGAQTGSSPVTPIQHVIVIIGENRSFDHVCRFSLISIVRQFPLGIYL